MILPQYQYGSVQSTDASPRWLCNWLRFDLDYASACRIYECGSVKTDPAVTSIAKAPLDFSRRLLLHDSAIVFWHGPNTSPNTSQSNWSMSVKQESALTPMTGPDVNLISCQYRYSESSPLPLLPSLLFFHIASKCLITAERWNSDTTDRGPVRTVDSFSAWVHLFCLQLPDCHPLYSKFLQSLCKCGSQLTLSLLSSIPLFRYQEVLSHLPSIYFISAFLIHLISYCLIGFHFL